VKTIGISDLRQHAARVIEDVQRDGEPTVILQRSRRVAYLVAAQSYEAERAELATARRALFLREVREAEADYTAGEAHSYEDVESLIDDLRA
jgi:prevent-host-death family protein